VSWFFLFLAIAAEVAATLGLRASDGLRDRRWAPAVVGGYALSFASLSFSLREGMPVGVSYAIWAAAGVASTAFLAHILFGDPVNRRMGVGIGFIVIGVALVHLGASAS
jgi:small multidrug resistance pump